MNRQLLKGSVPRKRIRKIQHTLPSPIQIPLNQTRPMTRFLLLSLLAFLPGVVSSTTTQTASKDSYLKDLSTDLGKTWPDNRTINIVCHGHSVPAGYFKTPVVDTFNAYPHLLLRGLKERFPHAVINVIVTSICGESSDKGAARFEETVLNHNPDLILIDYALNDRRLGLETAKTVWLSMIEEAQSRNIKLILLTPTADKRADLNNAEDPLNQHAEQIRELATIHQVALVDSLEAFKSHVDEGGNLTDLLSQSNHPNRKGHELVAEAVLDWFPE